MKKVILLLFFILIVVLHVHLNMFTVENPLNPSFWIVLIMECPPFFGGGWRLVSDIMIMGVQSMVTFIFAKYILKWINVKMWLLSYIICVFLYLLIGQLVYIPEDNALYQCYDCIYGYGGAFRRCIVFSACQIIFIAVYWIGCNIKDFLKKG